MEEQGLNPDIEMDEVEPSDGENSEDGYQSDNSQDIGYDDEEIWEPPMPNPGVLPPNQPDIPAAQSNTGHQNIENQL